MLLVAAWEREFQEWPHLSLTDKGDPLCLDCLGEQGSLGWTPVSLLGVWDFGTCRGCLYEPLPIKTLGAESLIGFPVQEHCTYVTVFLEEECIPCDPSWGKVEGSLHKGSSRLFLCLFHYGPAVRPYHITAINLSHEYNYRLSAMSPFWRISKCGVVLRTPNTHYVWHRS